MNPKEKAAELVGKFKLNDYDWIAQGSLFCVKQHAIVAIDEVIKALEITTGHCELRRIDQHEVNNDFSYWQKVKAEIELL